MKKVERLKNPKIDLKAYQFDPYEQNPLLNFNLSLVRKQQKCNFLQKRARQVVTIAQYDSA